MTNDIDAIVGKRNDRIRNKKRIKRKCKNTLRADSCINLAVGAKTAMIRSAHSPDQQYAAIGCNRRSGKHNEVRN